MVLVLRDGDEREAAAERVAARARRRPGAVVAVARRDGLGRRGAGAARRGRVRRGGRRARAPWHDATRMALDRLLWRWREQPDLTAYVERMLGPVLAHDARRKHQLLPTLEALCLHGGRKAETARALHLNRQALYDRIARLEQVLGRRPLRRAHAAGAARRARSAAPLDNLSSDPGEVRTRRPLWPRPRTREPAPR